MRLARKHHLVIPTRVLSLYRTLLTADSVATELDPALDFEGLSRRFFERLELEEISRVMDSEAVTRQAIVLLNLWRDAPVRLREVLIDLSEGRLTVNTAAEESGRTRFQKNKRTRLISACIFSIGLAALVTTTSLPTIGGISLNQIAFAALIINYVYIAYRWRL
jgi:predicted unusual protein kinase regulating ubiquinone biosynthesis (AarF/ABC1/UbiB family)